MERIGYAFVALIFVLTPFLSNAQQDNMAVDTSGWEYKIGYEIGSWLPFIILAVIFVFLVYRISKDSRNKA